MIKPIQELAGFRFVGLGGGFGAGKDYVASTYLPNHRLVKVAAPLYRLAEDSLGKPVLKTDPGGRELLQRLGAWGRGEVNDKHPLSAERAAAVLYYRTHFDFRFGQDPAFWAIQFEETLGAAPGDVVCTDLRFPEEIIRFRKYGPTAFVLSSNSELTARRRACGYKPSAASDPSEAIAEDILSVLAWHDPDRLRDCVLLRHGFSAVVWNDTPDGIDWDTVRALDLPVYAAGGAA